MRATNVLQCCVCVCNWRLINCTHSLINFSFALRTPKHWVQLIEEPNSLVVLFQWCQFPVISEYPFRSNVSVVWHSNHSWSKYWNFSWYKLIFYTINVYKTTVIIRICIYLYSQSVVYQSNKECYTKINKTHKKTNRRGKKVLGAACLIYRKNINLLKVGREEKKRETI